MYQDRRVILGRLLWNCTMEDMNIYIGPVQEDAQHRNKWKGKPRLTQDHQKMTVKMVRMGEHVCVTNSRIIDHICYNI